MSFMRKITLTTVVILLVLVGTSVSLAVANPFPTNPKISVLSPANETYNVQSLVLDIMIETKYDGYYFNGTRRVSYSVDGEANASATETSYSYSPENTTSTTKYTAALPELTDGLHCLKVYAEYDYDAHVISSQAGVYFTIDTMSEVPEFTPWVFLSLFLIATLAVIICQKKLRFASA